MNRNAHCFFCDDIRFEQGFKTSMMGIYGGELLVESMPAFLPKLCIAAFCEFPVSETINTLVTKVFIGDMLIYEQAIPPEDLLRMQSELSMKDTLQEPLETISFGLNIIISPLNIDSPSILKVTMILDGKDYHAGKLRIKIAEPQSLT